MTNKQRADFLLNEAKECLQDIKRAIKKELWNRAIRRAQEAVELSLKAVVKFLNFEYPKKHDIAPFLEKILKDKKIEVKGFEEIKRISQELVRKRAPAFYGEVFYSREEALQAEKNAKKVYQFCHKLIKNMEQNL